MSVTQEQLDGFYQVATDRIQQGGIDTPEELFDLWRLLNPTPSEASEINESIRRGIDEIRAGGGRPARDAAEEIRQQYGFSE